ncbi:MULTISPECIES: hypothetical protein [Acinetobacter]|nr:MULTISPECIES: hypothetical protein [Acinetobacter]BCT90605.1 hypothetical protein RYU24_30100 [Acinetobacter variabilis]
MLKDLIFTVALLCICFMLLIMLNKLALTTETNILLSSVFIGWTLLQFVRGRMFFYISVSLMIGILTLLGKYEEVLWNIIGLMAGYGVYNLLQRISVPALKGKLQHISILDKFNSIAK